MNSLPARLARSIVLAAAVAGGRTVASDVEEAASLLEAPAPLAAALRSRFAPQARVLRLGVRPDGADVEVQDAANPANVDRYEFEDGAFGAPEPVQVGRNRRQLNARLFRLADVDLSVLPRLVADARRRAETGEPQVTQVTIERTEGYGDSATWGRPLVRVVVDGPRGGAVVEYGLDARHRTTSRW